MLFNKQSSKLKVVITHRTADRFYYADGQGGPLEGPPCDDLRYFFQVLSDQFIGFQHSTEGDADRTT